MAADLQFNVTALDKATATFLKLAEQVDRLSKKIDQLDGKKAEVKVGADTKGADAGLDNVGRKVKDLDGKKATVKVDVDKSLSDSLIQVTRLGSALRALALPAAAIAAAPQIAAIGSAAVAAVGAVGLIPGALGAVGLAAGTASVSFGNLLKYFTADSPKKQKEAYDALSASGQHLADVIKGLSPRFVELRHATQDAVFKGLADQVKPLADAYLPALQREMVAVGRVFNTTAISLSTFFRQKSVASDLTSSLMSMRLAVTNVVLAARPLAQVLVDVIATSSARLPGLTKGFSDLAVRFAAFVNNARNSGQLGAWIDRGVQTVGLLGRTVLNVGSILMSVFRSATSEGQNFVQKLADITGQVAAFLKSTQGQNALGSVFGAISAGVEALRSAFGPLVPLLAEVVRIVGTNLVAVFQALSGPLNQITTALAHSLGPVLPQIGEAFRQIALAVVPMVAPVLALIPAFDSLAQVLEAAAVVAAKFLTSMAGTGAAIFSAIVPLIRAAADALTFLLHVAEPLAPAIGAIVAAFLAWRTASSVVGVVQGLFASLGTKIADVALNAGVLTEKFTGSAAAGEKVATAGDKVSGVLGKMGTALPIIGAGLVAISAAYDEWGSKADQAAQKVLNGSTSLQTAIAQEADQVHRNQIEWLGGMNAQESYAVAAKNVRAELDEQMAKLGPMEQLQAKVAMAQANLNDAVAQFGPNSSQASAAASELALAKDRLRTANEGAAQAEKTLGDQIVDTQNKAAAAANADIAYQQAVLNIASAEDAAAQAVKQHGEKSREAQQAHLGVMQAYLSAADAARRKAEADAAASGVADTAKVGAQAYKEALLQLADQASGPTRQALLDMAKGTGTAGQAADTTRLQTSFFKDELQQLADKASGPLKDALLGAKRDLDNAGGAHATAQQKADAQRAMLSRLADQAKGPTRDAILAMIASIDKIHDQTFTIKGVGQVSYGSPELLRAAHGGYTGGIVRMGRAGLAGVAYADGGITPGYTPGRDVHRFRSATGGTLDLSGGEAVMRPEWTAAVGPGYVHGANAAARSGGVGGVRRYMGGYADGGIIDGLPHQRLAMGGGIQLSGTQPFSAIPGQLFNTVAGSLVGTITTTLNAAIKALAAQAAAMAAAAAASVAGGIGAALGGGGGRAFIVAHESGGNPRAQNPTSSASGLYQMIDGTWRAYGGSTAHAKDASVAEQNAVADRYVAARYGSWDAAAAFWASHHWYDRGGYLMPGSTLAMNATGQRERILDPGQTRVWEQISSAAAGGARSSGGDGGALIAELRTQNQLLRALRGDVDQSGSFDALIGEVRGLRVQLASAQGSAMATAQAARTQSEFGAWL